MNRDVGGAQRKTCIERVNTNVLAKKNKKNEHTSLKTLHTVEAGQITDMGHVKKIRNFGFYKEVFVSVTWR